MIGRLISGFIAILLGTSLIGVITTVVYETAVYDPSGYATGENLTTNLSAVAPWGSTVLKLVPGFFALAILGVGIAVTYGSLRDAGVL